MEEQLLELIWNELFVFELHSEKDIIYKSVRNVFVQGNLKEISLAFRYKDVDFYGHMNLLELLETFELKEVTLVHSGEIDEVIYSNY